TPLSFLCGIGAYSLTDTRKVGVIAFSGDERVNAFIDGIKEAGPNGNVEVYYIEENTDDETLNVIADVLYSSGADIVFTLIGNKTNALIDKAREWGRYVIVGDDYYATDSTVILSVKKDIKKAVSLVIGKIKEGAKGGESVALGLKDGVLDLSWFINEESLKNLDENMKTKIVEAKSLLRRYRYELINRPQV
ncbi:MAG: BMP family ABC transporter substrate-binding protein, partial [Spirochaetales bacterium]|nr:BMP family ABC transporter substrate-binding protein [Spirochaetales bacterium]